MMRASVAFALSLVTLALGGLGAVPVQGAAASAPRSSGIVYLFSGMVWPLLDSTAGTGVEQMMRQFMAVGVQAEVYGPGDWEKAVDSYLASDAPSTPVAVVGYSLGANAALLFSRRLEKESIPVQTLVLIESAKPAPIPGNVRRAVHFSVSEAEPMTPGIGFFGSLKTVDLARRDPRAANLNHWSVSHFELLHKMIAAEIIDGKRVRVRGVMPVRGLRATPQRRRATH
jgi:hypothetical protein